MAESTPAGSLVRLVAMVVVLPALALEVGCLGETSGSRAGTDGGSSGTPDGGGALLDGGGSGLSDGGGSGDGSTLDGAIPDDGGAPDPDGGAPLGPCEGRVFCDDFESHEVGQAPDAPLKIEIDAESTIAVVDDRAASGSKSVRVSASGGLFSRRAMLVFDVAPFFPRTAGFYGRVMFYAPTAPGTSHAAIVQGTGLLEGTQNRATLGYGGGGGDVIWANFGGSGGGLCNDCWLVSETRIPVGQWACLEWFFDAANQETRLFIDGQEIADVHANAAKSWSSFGGAGSWVAPVFEKVAVGWESYLLDGDVERVVYLDDLAIDDARIGCPH